MMTAEPPVTMKMGDAVTPASSSSRHFDPPSTALRHSYPANIDSPAATCARSKQELDRMAAIAGTASGNKHIDERMKPEESDKDVEKDDDTDQNDEEEEEEEESEDASTKENDDDVEKENKVQDKETTSDDGDDKDKAKQNEATTTTTTKKSRRELPPHTVAILKGWMLSPEHVKHPYPTDEDKQMLLKKTGINMKQLTNWFTNARKRIWKPMMRREHSRQLQNAMEYDKARAYNGMPLPPGAPGAPMYAAYPPRSAVVRHSFDAGSLGPPRDRLPPPPPHGYEHAHPPYPVHHAPPLYPPPPPHHAPPSHHAHGHPQDMGYVPPNASYPPRAVRSMSESATAMHHEMEGYTMAMHQLKKRPHERSPDGGEGEAGEKRYRRSAIMSPRSIKVLQDWVAAHAHQGESSPYPSDQDKLQLSRETGLDVQQIEIWFKNNRDRMAPSHGAPMAPVRTSSIPSRDNPQFPPPPYERRSIPSSGNPMFPPRPSVVRSSIPSANNPQFPPPPSMRRELSEGYRPNLPYPPSSSSESRPMRSMSTIPFNRPTAPGASGGTHVLPSLSSRNLMTRASAGPTMGQARDSRSHTLDMGLFTDARRRKMNFQDVLASTSSSNNQPPAPPRQRPSLSSTIGLAHESESSTPTQRAPYAPEAISADHSRIV